MAERRHLFFLPVHCTRGIRSQCSSMHFTAKPSAGSKAWSSCNIAYRLGRTAATHCRSGSLAHPSPLRSSHCSLASSTVDIVSVEELTARVERWSRVVKEGLGEDGGKRRSDANEVHLLCRRAPSTTKKREGARAARGTAPRGDSPRVSVISLGGEVLKYIKAWGIKACCPRARPRARSDPVINTE